MSFGSKLSTKGPRRFRPQCDEPELRVKMVDGESTGNRSLNWKA